MNPLIDLPAQSKLPRVKTTIFAVMSALAAKHGALNLSQGFPDFSCPHALMDAVTRAMQAGHNQYAPMTGIPALREQIAVRVKAMYGAEVDVDQDITVTAGATEALFVAIQACVRAGDEVIVFDPAYDSYEPAVELAGGRCVHLPLAAPDYRIDFDRLADAINPRTRLIIINSPHNPSGSMLESADLDALEQLVANTGIMLISDEVYEHIVFDGREHQSILRRPALAERSFVISSFGKTYHTTGWKIGYCIAPKGLSAEFRKIHQYVTFCVATPLQHATAEFMASSDHHLELPAFYQAKRDRFRGALVDSAWQLLPCSGTYFQLLGYSAFDNRADTDMADWLTREVGVAAIPISVFNADGRDERILRFCFAKDDATLDAATEKLAALG